MDAKKVSDKYKIDMMQGCNHSGYFHTGIGKEGFSAIQNANRHDHDGINGLPRTGPYYATGGAMLEDCTKYKQRIADLESMLRDLEWSGRINGSFCPSCNGWKRTGHYTDCRLNNLLKTVDKP